MAALSLDYSTPPRVFPQYVRAAVASGELAVGETIPRLEARLAPAAPSASDVKRYRKVCGFAASAVLPITFPHIMAFPLHMALLTSEEFPLKLLGLVHIRNSITQHAPVPVGAQIEIQTWAQGHTRTDKGIEFDVNTQALVDGQLMWESVSTNLSRRKKPARKGSDQPGKPPAEPPSFSDTTTFKAPGNTGRRYARVSGDFNPIHLTALSAKAFGFPRAIAHGMWTKARLAGVLQHDTDQSVQYSVGFKKPVLLPAKLQAHWLHDQSGVIRAALTGDKGARWEDKTLHLTADISRIGNTA